MGACSQGLGRARRVAMHRAAAGLSALIGCVVAAAMTAQASFAQVVVAQPRPAPSAPGAAAQDLAGFQVVAGAIDRPLADLRGDATRGREVVFSRESNCTLCHQVPGGNARSMGNLGPPIDGAGARLSEGQLRLRMVDSSLVVPESIMPAYYRAEGRVRVAAAFAGRPVLDAQAIEDVVAYLGTLR